MINRAVLILSLSLLAACGSLIAAPRQVDDHTWEGIERIVAVGDLHGDYDHYIETLRLAGLVNKRGKWTGGATHLVQTGDIPDRGPDTREIMDHIDGLAEEAQKDGGYVHRLIGNHEAMNVYGDLRYVTTPEFEAFEGRNSKVIRNRYFDLVMEDLANRDPEAFAALPENYREQWDAEHPLGWVEHRQAWDPAWNRDGEYFLRAEDLKAAVKINDTVFVHGGISDIYAGMPLSEMTQQAHQQMANFDFENPGLIADECGPFWYRGISGESPEASPEVLTSILERLSAERIVVGHTPTPGFVWPRYQGRVVQIDTGIAEHYGGYPAYLEITANGLVAGYPGGKVHLPTSDEARAGYLEQVIALDPDRKTLPLIRDRLLAASEIEAAVDLQESEETAEAEAEGESEEVTEAQAVVDPCLRAAGE